MKRIRKILKWTTISIFGLFGFLVLTLIVTLAFGITLNLDRFRPTVERTVSDILDRNVSITGSVSLEASLRPILEIHDVRIDNPDGWNDSTFASMEMARVQIGLWALLNKQIDLGEITAKKVELNLHTNEQGNNNWQFATPADDPPEEPQPQQPEIRPTPEPSRIGLQALDKLLVQQLNISYCDDSVNKTLIFVLDELAGTAPQSQPLKLKGRGSFQQKSYNFILEAGPLNEFRLRQQLYPLSITGEVAGSPFTAKGSLGRHQGQPRLDLDSTLSNVNIGALLEWLNLAEGIDAQTDELALNLQLEGENLQQLLTQSNVAFSLHEGRWMLYGASAGSRVRIEIKEGSVSALAGEPVSLNLDGLIDEIPINIQIRGMELINYIQNPEELPVTVKVQTAGVTLDFQGELAMPVNRKDVSLAMTLKGEDLNTLNELLRLDLPPVGPYSVDAQFAMSPQGYDLSQMKIKVGTSDLAGRMVLNTEGDKLQIESELTSNLLQIDDFALGQWSPERKTDQLKESEPKDDKTEAEQKRDQEKALALLSPEALSRADAHFIIDLAKVMSGKDVTGRGSMEIGLQDGRFSIDPLELELADGTGRLEFSYYPTQEAAQIHLGINVEGLDVGVLARRAKPETNMGGRLNLDILLDSTAPSIGELMANGDGYFDLSFAPENFDARIIDLWAISLLSVLRSEVDSEPTSTINCLVASFEMEDGLMQDRIIFMDTTRMSVEGTAKINFKTRQLSMRAKPTAKRPEFFSIAIPIQVSGSFDDFGVGVKAGHLITTIGSFITSPVHVPIRWLFSGEIPADGNEACRIAWERRKSRK